MQTKGAPSHSRYSHFRCEEATVVDVNRRTWTVTVQTRFMDKSPPEVQVLSPYLHHVGGEGFHHMPEPGATCYVAFPNDNTPPFIIGYKGVANAVSEEEVSEVSFRSRRPRMDPGDIGFSGRDGNFILLRRGGIVEVGCSSMAQRVYLPIKHTIKDFSENYQQSTLAGDVTWHVDRVEDDPDGLAKSVWVFHMNEHAQDAKASVRIAHYGTPPEGSVSVAYDMVIAPSGIDKATGEVSEAVYRISILSDGSLNQLSGARVIRVEGDDSVTATGNLSYTCDGDATFGAGGTTTLRGRTVVTEGKTLHGSANARSPHVLGDVLVQWAASQVWPVDMATLTAKPTPASIAQLQRALSRKVFLE